QQASGYDIDAQRYNAAGAPVGSEYLVNQFTTGSQSNSDLAVRSDGTLFVTWMSNGQDGSDQGVYARIYAPNLAPVANSGSNGGNEDQTITGSVSASDPDGDAISFGLVTGPQHGVLTFNSNGTYSYTPNADYNGSDSFTFRASDGLVNSSPASVTLTINPVNDAPLVTGSQPSLAHGQEDVACTVTAAQLLAGFGDVDGDTLSIAALTADRGTVTANSDGTYTITQAPNFNGDVVLSYSVVDGQGGSVAATLGYTVDAVNDAPQLTAAPASLAGGTEDVVYTVSAGQLLAGFTDVDGDTLSVANLAASSGSVVGNGDGTYTVTQPANYNGGVTLSYNVVDGNGGSVAASLAYTIAAVNDAPSLTGSTSSLAHGTEDVAYSVSLAQLLAGYTDADGDFLSIAGLTADHGSVTLAGDGTYTIAPATDYNGSMTLSYRVDDGHGGSTAASVGYIVDAVNDDPQLIGAPATLPNATEDLAYTVTTAQLVSGFVDAEQDKFSISNLSADRGTVVDNGNGTYTITQAANFNGQVKLTYSVVDGNGGSSPAQIYYSTSAVNDAPTGSVTISGLAATGQQLTAFNTLADADGLGTISYQWLLDGKAIAGATGYSYTVKSADLGHVVSVVASYTDAGGTFESVTSAATAAIVQGPGTFTGTSAADTLSASNFDDTLVGLAGNDTLRGLAGNDVLRGGAGNDLLDGGADMDTADYSDATAAVRVSLAVTTSQNTGGSGSDTLVGIENLLGSAYGDTLTGDAGANRLNGGGGGDTLSGGVGADTFVFDVLTTTANRDTIKDFVSGTDTIELATGAFSALAGYAAGQLDAGELTLGTAATNASQHLIYDSKTGNLMYDADGSGSGAAVTIAVLTGHPTILASDIFLI
ncbi:MAG TPA: cadherin-like domain-containing protein, partial [Sphingomicrobium sp.]